MSELAPKPLEDVDLVATARWHVQQAINCSESSVPVTIDRAHAHAQIGATLLQLHELERDALPPHIEAIALTQQQRESFTIDVIVRIVREAKHRMGTLPTNLESVNEALKEIGRGV